MNPLMKLLDEPGNNTGNGAKNNSEDTRILIGRMIGAAMSGKSPENFLNTLAQTDSRFKGMDFTNLDKTAQEVCNKNNIDMSDAVKKVSGGIGNFLGTFFGKK